MLADVGSSRVSAGQLDGTVILRQSWWISFVQFLCHELPKWRDDPRRPEETAEDMLTSQLCRHMNSAARMTRGWDFLQFRTEEADEIRRNRSIDLTPAPVAATIWIDGREYTHYKSLMPIECKRLPTPKGSDRDYREYLYSGESTVGGVQRFKEGHHGAAHTIGAIIGYIQDQDIAYWASELHLWLQGLIHQGVDGWMRSDELHNIFTNAEHRTALFKSVHSRVEDLGPIHMRHLWIEMTK